LIYASLTSTSTSSDCISTMVPMPVRVNPPPAETGEIISPGCADLLITTPVNGARITRSSSASCATATRCRVTSMVRAAANERACRVSASACKRSSCASLSRLSAARVVARASARCAWPSCVASSAARACCSRTWLCTRANCAWAVLSSRRAIICPCSTRMPSSIITCTILPVVLELTVAAWRATT